MPRSPLFVATEKNVVAALASKDGSIQWRKVLGEGDAIDQMVVTDGRVIVLSGGGKMLRAFEAERGMMQWQVAVEGAPAVFGVAPPIDLIAFKPEAQSPAAVLALGGLVQAFDAASGSPLWEYRLRLEGPPSPVRLSPGVKEQQGTVWVAAVQASQQELVVVQLSAVSGQVVRQWSAPPPSQAGFSQQHLLLTPQSLVALTDGGSQICAQSLLEVSPSPPINCERLAALLPAGKAEGFPSLVDPGSGGCPEHVAIHTAAGTAALSVQGGTASLSMFVEGATSSGCFNAPGAGPLLAFTSAGMVAAEEEEVENATGEVERFFTVEVRSAVDGSTVLKYNVPQLVMRDVGEEPLPAARTWLLPFATKTRPLVLMEEHTLALLPTLDQKPFATADPDALPVMPALWLRPEALAGVTSALMVDLPLPTPDHEAAWQEAQPTLGDTVAAQLLALKSQFKPLDRDEAASLASYRATTNDRLRPTRDADGFRKMILVTTEAGKVAALHNGDGHLMWSLNFGVGTAPSRLVEYLEFSDALGGAEVAALHPGLDMSASVRIDIGQVWAVETIESDVPAVDLMPLPMSIKVDPDDVYAHYDPATAPEGEEAAVQHVYALIPENPGSDPLTLLPDSPPARDVLRAVASNFSFWRVSHSEGVVRGYALRTDDEGEHERGTAHERWSVVLAPPGSGLEVLAVTGHATREAVPSHAKVLGDGSLKFKYLNPNTVLVAVGAKRHAAVQGGDHSDPPPPLTVYMLDTITGRVLTSHTHKAGRGPVHAVLCEHWAVYHFWNAEQFRWQMSVIELYDASSHDLRVLDLAFKSSAANVSSWEATPLEVLHDSYFTKFAVTQLSVTRTARGITARQILMSTTNGRVYMLDKRMLDPRRPRLAPGTKPTAEMQAEGLLPYQEELPISTMMYATLDKQVRNLRGVVTSPATMESTSLMFAHGLDLFYSRISPSRTFDLLPDDFPFALLVLIVVGMAGASAALGVLNRRTALKAKWE